jgi:hypothetical protein
MDIFGTLELFWATPLGFLESRHPRDQHDANLERPTTGALTSLARWC